MIARVLSLLFILSFVLLLPAGAEDNTDALLERLTLDQKLGQLFLVGHPEGGLDERWQNELRQGGLAGIVLSPHKDYRLPEELDALLSEARAAHGGEIPLLFAAPCEGGMRSLLHPLLGGAQVPEALVLGAAMDKRDIRAAYASLAMDFKRHGVHLSLGPATSLSTTPSDLSNAARAFGSDANRVTACVRDAIQGIQSTRILSAPVYFSDSVPFSAEAITLGDVFVLSDPGRMAMLREQVGDDGLLLSPDLSETAASAALHALQVGCDLLLLRRSDPVDLKQTKDALRTALEEGALSPAWVDQAVRRVLIAKQRAGVWNPHEELQPSITNESQPNGVVVVRDNEGVLPINPTDTKFLVVAPASLLASAEGATPLPVGATLGSAMRPLVREVMEVRFSIEPSDMQQQQALATAAHADVIIVGVLLPQRYPGQQRLVEAMLSLGKPVVLVGLDDPSGLEPFTQATALVAAHGYSPPALQAAAEVLLGRQPAGGRLPAPIGRLYPMGHAGP